MAPSLQDGTIAGSSPAWITMKNYSGIRKEMKEAGWNRVDRANEEQWNPPGSDRSITYSSAVRRFKKDKLDHDAIRCNRTS